MFEIIHILLKWIKPLLGCTLLAGAVAAAASLMMPNEYQSTVVFQPMNPGLLDRSIFSKDGSSKPIYMFGTKTDIDRVISLSSSRDMKSWVSKTFDLMKHYDINPDDELADFKLGQKFDSNFSILKNSQGAVDLSIIDINPNLARDIANNMALRIDSLNRELIMGKKRDQVNILKAEVDSKREDVAKMTAELNRMVTANPDDTISAGTLRKQLDGVIEDLETANTSYSQSKSITDQKLSTLYFFEMASAAKKKTKPVRSLIVLGAMAFTFIMLLFLAVFVEKFREYRDALSSK